MDSIGRFYLRGTLQDVDTLSQVYLRVPRAGRLLKVVGNSHQVHVGTSTVIGKNATQSTTVDGLSVVFTNTLLVGQTVQGRPSGDNTAVFNEGDVLELESDGIGSAGGEAEFVAEFQFGDG